jgi:hypothetical protein
VNPNNQNRQYGVANPVYTVSVAGAVNGDVFTPSYTTTATIASPVNTYPVTASLTPVGSASLSNYLVTYNNGTLTIKPSTTAPVVTVNNATRAYGVANPTFNSVTTGALNGDTFTIIYSTPATIASPIGPYSINAMVSGTAVANYTSVNVVPGTLTITQALTPLVITVNNVTRTYGAANPTFTDSVSGALNGDTFTATYSTLATATSDVGNYAVSATAAGAKIGDYATVTVVPGKLTVTPVVTTTQVVPSGTSVTWGTNVTFTATVTYGAGFTVPNAAVNFYNGTMLLGTGTSNASGVATFNTSSSTLGTATTTGTTAGGSSYYLYNITAAYQGSLDFSSSSGTAPLDVTLGSFTVTATPTNQFIRGGGSTVYTIAVSPVQGFVGPVALTCAGLPADASCTFASQTVTLASNGNPITTTMTVYNTNADARLHAPTLGRPTPGTPGGLSPIAFAAAFPFGLGALFAGLARRKRGKQQGETRANRAPKIRLLIAILCTAGILGVAGCACHTSIYQMYTISVTGTTSVSGVSAQTTGTSPNSASPTLTVAQQQ